MTDNRRDQLADVIPHADWCHVKTHGDELGCDCGAWTARERVDRMIRQAQAEALETAAEAIRYQLPGYIGRIDTADTLVDRAAALRATTDHVAVTDARGAAEVAQDGLTGRSGTQDTPNAPENG